MYLKVVVRFANHHDSCRSASLQHIATELGDYETSDSKRLRLRSNAPRGAADFHRSHMLPHDIRHCVANGVPIPLDADKPGDGKSLKRFREVGLHSVVRVVAVDKHDIPAQTAASDFAPRSSNTNRISSIVATTTGLRCAYDIGTESWSESNYTCDANRPCRPRVATAQSPASATAETLPTSNST
jgi:hypothetical protein